jgi:hypothetical protein
MSGVVKNVRSHMGMAEGPISKIPSVFLAG